MGTPNWFRFPSLGASVEQLFMKTKELREAHDIKPRDVTRLVWSDELKKMEFQDEPVIPIREEVEALDVANFWEGFCLTTVVRPIRADLYFYFWKEHGSTCVAIQTDDQVPYAAPPGMAEGEWLERFMARYVTACGAKACAHGRDWLPTFVPLEVTSFASQWRSRELLKSPLPAFLMLSEELLGADEAKALLQGQEVSRGLRYFRAPGGHHVLSSLCRRAWE